MEEERESLCGSGHEEGVDAENEQNREQHRHQDVRHPLDALLHPAADYEEVDCQEEERPENLAPSRGCEAVELGVERFLRRCASEPCRRLVDVFKRPSGDNAVEP